jgi:hypothetical protein
MPAENSICYHPTQIRGTHPNVTRELVDALADLLNDYLGTVIDVEVTSETTHKGIYSVKELRVMHMVFRSWRHGKPCTATQIANG